MLKESSGDLTGGIVNGPDQVRGYEDLKLRRAVAYRAELADRPNELAQLRDALRHGTVTLLYGARDTVHNHALVLADLLRDLCGEHLVGVLAEWGHTVTDLGTDSTEPVDYPPICAAVA